VKPSEEAEKMEESRGTEYPDTEQVQRALRRCWQPVARVSDLASGPQRSVLLGEPLTVFLTETGEPAVLADRCPHRGASLSLGQVRGAAIACPYHGWEWEGGGGRCTRIPSLPDQRQIPPEARVAAYPAREQWGLVWTALEEPIGELPDAPWLDEGDWQLGHGDPFELPVSFGVMIENFRDVAHFAFVHEGTLGRVPELVEPLQPKRDGTTVTMHRDMRTGPGADDVWAGMQDITYLLRAPNFVSALMHTTDGYRCLLHAARAISATESAHYWIEGMAAGCAGASLEEAIASETRIYAEDIAIISSVRPAEFSLDPSAELSTLSDSYTLAYREAFAEFVADATTAQSSSKTT
jgi:phenylpropionate dioxygenase-like ring-hydroxylating dioxygenase large terminal subunit